TDDPQEGGGGTQPPIGGGSAVINIREGSYTRIVGNTYERTWDGESIELYVIASHPIEGVVLSYVWEKYDISRTRWSVIDMGDTEDQSKLFISDVGAASYRVTVYASDINIKDENEPEVIVSAGTLPSVSVRVIKGQAVVSEEQLAQINAVLDGLYYQQNMSDIVLPDPHFEIMLIDGYAFIAANKIKTVSTGEGKDKIAVIVYTPGELINCVPATLNVPVRINKNPNDVLTAGIGDFEYGTVGVPYAFTRSNSVSISPTGNYGTNVHFSYESIDGFDVNGVPNRFGESYPLSSVQPTAVGIYRLIVSVDETKYYTEVNTYCDFTIFRVSNTGGDGDVKIVIKEKTANRVTVEVQNGGEGADYQYSIDGINWQDSPTFTNLTGGKKYEFTARTKATDTLMEGAPIAVSTTTNLEGWLIGIIVAAGLLLLFIPFFFIILARRRNKDDEDYEDRRIKKRYGVK
ncbi:MAG: hypothetical protein LBN25_02195, partial [Christensenellaceae bacterium]|nr:hypothetical protein [Christensenellaceae bacterium]